MYQILPLITSFALPELPPEIWSIIFRFLDPVSLMAAMRTDPVWNTICKNDPLLRRLIKEQTMAEREKHHEEILNPGVLMSLTRSGPIKLFSTNGTKIVKRRPATEVRFNPRTFQQKKKLRHDTGDERRHKFGKPMRF